MSEWIKHDGKGPPTYVGDGMTVRVKFRDGGEGLGEIYTMDSDLKENSLWWSSLSNPDDDIVEYKVVRR